MQLISALSLQMPWMTIEEFTNLSSQGLSAEQVSGRTREFLKYRKAAALEEAKSLMATCENLGIQILFPGHETYPVGCLDLEEPPLFLTFEGSWPLLPSIAIVGSREPSRFSVDWLNENLPAVYSRSEFLIVSGGARGIDLTAHLAAARLGKPTVVFLPSGLRNFYPKDLKRYKNLILESGGGFVSEFSPYSEMKKFYFSRRNRLIVASSDLVFVAEARRKSGSTLTAGIAKTMGKTVCTLPASPAQACAQGSLDIVFDGGFPIRDHLDLVALLGISSRRALR